MVGDAVVAVSSRVAVDLETRAIGPLHAATYIRAHPGSAPTVKQHLAAVGVLCDWLTIHQVLPVNPASVVRGSKHLVTKGATPVLTPTERRSRLDGIDAGSLVGRDRALLSITVYKIARVSAVVPGPRARSGRLPAPQRIESQTLQVAFYRLVVVREEALHSFEGFSLHS